MSGALSFLIVAAALFVGVVAGVIIGGMARPRSEKREERERLEAEVRRLRGQRGES